MHGYRCTYILNLALAERSFSCDSKRGIEPTKWDRLSFPSPIDLVLRSALASLISRYYSTFNLR
jgi:hypothetical protein